MGLAYANIFDVFAEEDNLVISQIFTYLFYFYFYQIIFYCVFL
ncbi:Flagellar biosynthetic protein fliR [Borrelia nietonii YOR]|uniref:Flagellar biosynthetic protein fliR n=1 Tax=Borrelia nietonii YOR TaxID=1293576 RepID=A0ABN4C766_9SPIR|nr:Flagellar biosynthetic protein fliR [Borrelia nietonii YOR]